MTSRRPQPRRAAPPESGDREPGWWKRWLLAPVVLLLCAVVAWLVPVPWRGPPERNTAEPAGVSASAPAPAPTARPSSTPDQTTPSASATSDAQTDATVERLGKKVANQEESYDVPVDRTEVKGVSTKSGPYVALGRIAIPEVGLDVSFGEGVFAETLRRGPGHWPGTPMPGRTGNSVLAGHRDTRTQPFQRIDELDPGDRIVVDLKDEDPVVFLVSDTMIVSERKYRQLALRQPQNTRLRQLTLFACHPEGDPSHRIVIRAMARAG